MLFDKVLIANRGEIAVRIIRTCQRMGYRTVAVFSEADRGAPHVALADEAVCIGAAPAQESYLSIDKLIGAAKASGAGAIHPGYGFLSERAAFAQAVQDAGLVFIGPDPQAIEAMGNKSASKIRMLAAGVPCVPGYQGDDQSDATLVAEAQKVGLPVMVKAAAGGGGRGMRLVTEAAYLPASIQSARSEAANAFGDGQLLIEKAVLQARHVEIQVFGDRHGTVLHIGERDCSVQRRNQKVVEEAPSPAVDEALRARMGAAAVAAARAVNYVGAGTVEFMAWTWWNGSCASPKARPCRCRKRRCLRGAAAGPSRCAFVPRTLRIIFCPKPARYWPGTRPTAAPCAATTGCARAPRCRLTTTPCRPS